jgi:hypothetical protein
MCSSGPCERRFNLRRKERFNKGARAIIHSNCLLPVLSDGWIEIPCYLFRMFWRLSLYCGDDCCAPGKEDKAGRCGLSADTHTIEHLAKPPYKNLAGGHIAGRAWKRTLRDIQIGFPS